MSALATLIRFQQGPGGQVNFHLEYPPNWPHNWDPYVLMAHPGVNPFDALELPNPPAGAVLSAGTALYDALCLHPAVKSQLEATLNNAAAVQTHAVGLQVESDYADRLPWEALYAGEQFCALNRLPVARLVGPKVTDLVKKYIFQPPLRLGIVMGASSSQPVSRISASSEWDSLRKTLEGAKRMGLRVQVLLLAAESDVRTEVEQSGLEVEVAAVTGREDLAQKLREFQPNILHFFCHGMSDDRPHLRISSAADWDSDADGSIIIEAEDLRQQIDPKQNAWLVVLNCCESAAGSVLAKDVRSLAATLIRKGFPAVLGMREAVESRNARLLTEQFYGDVFEYLGHLKEEDDYRPINWAHLLVRGRARLRDQCAPQARPNAAADTKEWTIPAMYMRTEEFVLKRIDPKIELTAEERAALRSEIQLLQTSRDTVANLPMPEATKQQALADIDLQIQIKTKRLS